MSPQALLGADQDEARRFGAELLDGRVEDGGFVVTLDHDRRVVARGLLVTTGWRTSPGSGALGRDVLHCPYCLGWEVRDRAIGVLAMGPLSVHQALVFRQLSADIKYFSHTTAPPTDEQSEQLAARGIGLVDGEVASLEVARKAER